MQIERLTVELVNGGFILTTDHAFNPDHHNGSKREVFMGQNKLIKAIRDTLQKQEDTSTAAQETGAE